MSATIAEGEIIAGKYRVEKVLGRGGMGVVVAATHLSLGHKVAIKLLLPGATPEIIARFAREARASVRLKCEHVARVLDVGELQNGTPYMVMEYLEGKDLSAVLKARGQLPITEAVQHVLHACEAIAEAHSAGIIHRDLKPANLLLTEAADGTSTVKVLDFGISKANDPSSAVSGEGMSLTQTAAVLGSPAYMSPEQMKASRNVDARSDIWSLGIILYQLLAGRTPFKGQPFAVLVVMVNLDAPPPLSQFRADVPAALEAAILRCLEKKPEDRFQNAAELAEAIAPFGPEGAQASADRTARTLEMNGITSTRSRSLRPPPVAAAPVEIFPCAEPAAAAAPLVRSEPSGITALASVDPSGAGLHPPRSKLVPVGVALALALGVSALALALRGREPLPDRPAPAESAAPVVVSAPLPILSAGPTIAPAASLAPIAAPIEAEPVASASAAPPVKLLVAPKPPPPPPPLAPPPGKKNPLDIKIK